MHRYAEYLKQQRQQVVNEQGEKREVRKIESMIKRYQTFMKSIEQGINRLPKDISPKDINNGVSMIGLNYKGIGKPASLETLFQ